MLFFFGAGMSVDAGIPDYRGANGLYTANGPLGSDMADFMPLLQGRELQCHARKSWDTWRQVQNLCRFAKPHVGHRYLAKLANSPGKKYFVVTSNVDELASQAGFRKKQIHACHGNIFTIQCSVPCARAAWPLPYISQHVAASARPIPLCPVCEAPARPNVYFFGDSERSFVWEANQKQAEAFSNWLSVHEREMLMLEVGCGLGAPGLRRHAESFLMRCPNSRLIRINEHEAEGEGIA